MYRICTVDRICRVTILVFKHLDANQNEACVVTRLVILSECYAVHAELSVNFMKLFLCIHVLFVYVQYVWCVTCTCICAIWPGNGVKLPHYNIYILQAHAWEIENVRKKSFLQSIRVCMTILLVSRYIICALIGSTHILFTTSIPKLAYRV